MTRMMRAIFVVAVLGTMFQIGHFFEHATQWLQWIFGDRTKPWMSPIANWLCDLFGNIVYAMPAWCTDTGAWHAKQMMLGTEVLHLVGNSIFLVTIAAILFLFTQQKNPYRMRPSDAVQWSKWDLKNMRAIKALKWALAVETFHLYEHIMLTATAFFLGKPVGFSTLFGGSPLLFGPEGAVGFRVSWHFFLNLVPTYFMMKALMPIILAKLNKWIEADIIRQLPAQYH